MKKISDKIVSVLKEIKEVLDITPIDQLGWEKEIEESLVVITSDRLRSQGLKLIARDVLATCNINFHELKDILGKIKELKFIESFQFYKSDTGSNNNYFIVRPCKDFNELYEKEIKDEKEKDFERFLSFYNSLLLTIEKYDILKEEYYEEERGYFIKKYLNSVPEFLKKRRTKKDFLVFLTEVASGDGSWAKRRERLSLECEVLLNYLEFGEVLVVDKEEVGIFSKNLINKIPKDIGILCYEFNFNYINRKPNAGMLLLRRILPLSIVRKFQILNRENEIKNTEGDFLNTKELLGKIEKELNHKRIYKEILDYKVLLDGSQHSYSLNVDLTDNEGSAVKIRILLDDLFGE